MLKLRKLGLYQVNVQVRHDSGLGYFPIPSKDTYLTTAKRKCVPGVDNLWESLHCVFCREWSQPILKLREEKGKRNKKCVCVCVWVGMCVSIALHGDISTLRGNEATLYKVNTGELFHSTSLLTWNFIVSC